MRPKLLFVFILLLASSVFGQWDKKLSASASKSLEQMLPSDSINYWIFLKPEAIANSPMTLSPASLERRGVVDDQNYLVDEHDYPILQSVIDEINGYGTVRNVLRWFKAVTVSADSMGLAEIANLSYVESVDLVQRFSRQPDEATVIDNKNEHKPKSLALDYGSTLTQNEFIKATKLHQAGLSGKGVIVAVFDTGFDLDHPAFDSTDIIAAYDFINADTSVGEWECIDDITNNHQAFHGTATFGVMGGYVPGEMIGPAYGASYLLAKTEISCGRIEINIEEDNWIAAAQWADSAGANIVNSSLGYYVFDFGHSYTQTDLDGNTARVTIAADIAASKNILMVNSAGNERNNDWGTIIHPADGDSVIAVGAVTVDTNLASFSSPGPSADGRIKPDITTLGVGVIAPYHVGGYISVSGTSFSSPLVAAGAALALEHDPTLSADDLRQLIKESGDRYDNPDNNYGYGLFDATKTANIIGFEKPYVLLFDDFHLTAMIYTKTGTDSIPELMVSNLPQWLDFTDNHDGTASLDLNQFEREVGQYPINVIADIGYFVDTTEFIITSGPPSVDFLRFGPNPFSDTISFFITIRGDKLLSLTIFNLAGEIVWEKVNNFNQVADVIIEQWDGRNFSGKDVADGVYLFLIQTEHRQSRLKLLKVDT